MAERQDDEPWLFEEARESFRVEPEPGTSLMPEPLDEPALVEVQPLLFDWQPAHDELFLQQPEAYFILAGDDAIGPFSPEEIRDRLEEGRLAPDAYAWNQGLDEWLPLHRLFAFARPEDTGPSEQAISSSDPSLSRLADFLPRLTAGAIDLLVIVAAFFVTMVAVPPFRTWIEVSSLSPSGLLSANLILSILTYMYFMLFLGPLGRGRTPGYRLARLQLVDQATRQAPSWLQSFLWCAGSIVLPIGWMFYWFDRQRRMLHNGISGTIVIDLAP